jgi:hypothetical protein
MKPIILTGGFCVQHNCLNSFKKNTSILKQLQSVVVLEIKLSNQFVEDFIAFCK